MQLGTLPAALVVFMGTHTSLMGKVTFRHREHTAMDAYSGNVQFRVGQFAETASPVTDAL
jgi:hypothetical protein